MVKKSKAKAKAIKKSSTQPSRGIEVTVTKKILGEAPEQHHFILKGGRHLKSIQELAGALEVMNDDVFSYHVNDMKNDFATWINDIFNENALANELRKTKNRIETRIKLLQRLVDDVIREGRKSK